MLFWKSLLVDPKGHLYSDAKNFRCWAIGVGVGEGVTLEHPVFVWSPEMNLKSEVGLPEQELDRLPEIEDQCGEGRDNRATSYMSDAALDKEL